MPPTLMTPTLFVICEAPERAVPAGELDRLCELLSAVPGLTGGAVLTPTETVSDQPFAADGRGPALAVQLDFASDAALAASLAADGPFRDLDGALPSLAGQPFSHQAMSGRAFAVADPTPRPPAGGLPLTFLVQYPGTAGDLPAWLDHYDANHPPIMVRFPGIRAVQTFRPVEGWTTGLPWTRSTAMQRNKVVFDSAAALVAALSSPVMAEMRADAATFPPYAPRATHHPMNTRVI